MDVYKKFETVHDVVNPLPDESNINVVLDVPWLRVQHLLQESDSVINSRSLLLNQSRRASTEDSDFDGKICQNCHAKTRELEDKLAEIQQQLTVAVSSNFTKNVMIEQLDKTLCKIVEGWKKLEAEKISQINKLEEEKTQALQDLKREQEVIIKVERELTLTLDKLMLSQKEIEAIHNEKQSWEIEFESKISKLTNELTSTQNRNSSLIATNKTLSDEYENKLLDINNKFAASIQDWELHEDKYRTELNDNHLSLNALKQDQLQYKQTIKTSQLQLQLLSNQLDDVLREKESLKVEVSILQARNAAAKTEMEEREKLTIDSMQKENENKLINLEKLLIAQYEKKINELEIRYQKSLNVKLQEKADEDVKERVILAHEYEKAMQEQAERYDQLLRMREDDLKRQYRGKDEQIQDLMTQIQRVQHENAVLASGRSHLMAQIQALLEHQWQESLKVLYGNTDFSALNHLPICDSPTPDYHRQSVNPKRLHLCKTRVEKAQSQSNLMQDNHRMSFNGLSKQPKIHLCSTNYNEEPNPTLNEQFDAKQANGRCRSSFAAPESLCSCQQNESQPKMIRKTQSLLERVPTPDEFSKMTECSDSLPMSDIFLETEKLYNKAHKHRFRSGADKHFNESTKRHEERQLELKKYLERRPPGEPFDANKDLWPCKDENNLQINKNGEQFKVPSLNLDGN